MYLRIKEQNLELEFQYVILKELLTDAPVGPVLIKIQRASYFVLTRLYEQHLLSVIITSNMMNDDVHEKMIDSKAFAKCEPRAYPAAWLFRKCSTLRSIVNILHNYFLLLLVHNCLHFFGTPPEFMFLNY